MLRRIATTVIALSITASASLAAPKPRVIGFGNWQTVKWLDATGQKTLDLKVRALFVDARLKEYTTGLPHDVTDRLFVVRRVFRVNDTLPDENTTRWQWQRGGWLLVDRSTGRISQLNLPEFDPFYSSASWYRDFVAYCGVSDNGTRLYAVVAQFGGRKAVLKKPVGEATGGDAPDSECPVPAWERAPMRVTFRPEDGQRIVFSIRGRVLDIVNEPGEDPEE